MSNTAKNIQIFVFMSLCGPRELIQMCPSTCGGSLPRDGEAALLEEAREVGLACGGPSLRDGGILSRPFSLDE